MNVKRGVDDTQILLPEQLEPCLGVLVPRKIGGEEERDPSLREYADWTQDTAPKLLGL
jgi:hypothetical protein